MYGNYVFSVPVTEMMMRNKMLHYVAQCCKTSCLIIFLLKGGHRLYDLLENENQANHVILHAQCFADILAPQFLNEE